MEINVVSISRSLAAGGEEIGRLVAEELGFRYVDDEIINRAAEVEGVTPDRIAEAEHTLPLVQRILGGMSTGNVDLLDA